jgi:hypothetical protein
MPTGAADARHMRPTLLNEIPMLAKVEMISAQVVT